MRIPLSILQPPCAYDGEGRICAVQQVITGIGTIMTQYIYDAEGIRVAKGTITTWSCDNSINPNTQQPKNGFTPQSAYVIGPAGEQLSELNWNAAASSWQVAHTNVFAAGKLIATYEADLSGQNEGSLYFQMSDWLGTRRQQTDYAGNPCLNFIGQPYGDGLETIPVASSNCLDIPDATEHHFTGKERDSESGNDYFGARNYASTMGRFLSPDYSDGPDAVPFADLNDPQSLNLYSYVQNNPMNSVDDDGHLDCPDGATQDVACALAAAGKAVLNFLKSLGGDGSSVTTTQTIDLPTSTPPGVPEGGPGTATGPLIDAQDAARGNPSFQPRDGNTYCNLASYCIGQQTGSNVAPLWNSTNKRPNIANEDASSLAHSGAFHRVGPAEAQRLANLGKTVYGVWPHDPHGHIITVRPNNGPYTGSPYLSTGPNDPMIKDIGSNVGVYPLSYQPSPSFRQGVIFYAPNN